MQSKLTQTVLPACKPLSTSKCFAIDFQVVFIDLTKTTTILISGRMVRLGDRVLDSWQLCMRY